MQTTKTSSTNAGSGRHSAGFAIGLGIFGGRRDPTVSIAQSSSRGSAPRADILNRFPEDTDWFGLEDHLIRVHPAATVLAEWALASTGRVTSLAAVTVGRDELLPILDLLADV